MSKFLDDNLELIKKHNPKLYENIRLRMVTNDQLKEQLNFHRLHSYSETIKEMKNERELHALFGRIELIKRTLSSNKDDDMRRTKIVNDK